MAKLTDFRNPVSGERGNLFNLAGIWQMVLGAMVVLLSLGLGRSLLNLVTGVLPGPIAAMIRPARPAPAPAADGNGGGWVVHH